VLAITVDTPVVLLIISNDLEVGRVVAAKFIGGPMPGPSWARTRRSFIACGRRNRVGSCGPVRRPDRPTRPCHRGPQSPLG
jgi:hypothetical protein